MNSVWMVIRGIATLRVGGTTGPGNLGPAPSLSALSWLVAGLSVSTLGFYDVIPWWLYPVLAAIATWRLRQARSGVRPPTSWIRQAIAGGIILLLFATGTYGLGLDKAAPLCISLMWLKLLELDSERDVAATAAFGLFLAGGALLANQDLLHTLIAFTGATLLIGALWWYQSPHLGGLRAVDHNRLYQGRRRSPGAIRSVWWQVMWLFIQAIPVTIALFVFFPRPDPQQLARSQKDSSTGVSDRMEPGRFAANREDHSVAFRATFDGRLPTLDDLYWRGLVLWETDGLAWTRGQSLRAPSYGPKHIIRSDPNGDSRRLSGEISLIGNGQEWLYLPETATTIVDRAQFQFGLWQTSSQPANPLTTYRFDADLLARPSDGGAIILGLARQEPERPYPRIERLAETLRQGAKNGQEIVDRLQAWFINEGFIYTLEPGEMGQDPTTTFLFQRKRGYCSHYAGAAALILRYAGVPARVVVGFRGGEWNAQGGFLSVRNSDAHAWTEAFIQDQPRMVGSGGTWVRIDLTNVIPALDPSTGQPSARPANALTGPTAQAIARESGPWYEQLYFKARSWRDFVEMHWSRTIVAFDRDFQDRLLNELGLDELGRLGWVVALIGAAVAMGGVTWMAWFWLPELLARWRQPAHLRAFSELQRALSRAGAGRKPGEGPLDHGWRASGLLPEVADDILTATQAWLRLRYGSESDWDPRDVVRLRHATAAVRRATSERQAGPRRYRRTTTATVTRRP
jgi:transglutaminase-like putative cysteine protease